MASFQLLEHTVSLFCTGGGGISRQSLWGVLRGRKTVSQKGLYQLSSFARKLAGKLEMLQICSFLGIKVYALSVSEEQVR